MTHFEYETAPRYLQFAEEANLMDFLHYQSNQQLLKRVCWQSAAVYYGTAPSCVYYSSSWFYFHKQVANLQNYPLIITEEYGNQM